MSATGPGQARSPRTSAPRSRASWTSASELIDTLRRRWDRGTYLRANALGEPWAPVSLPVRGPDASQLLHRLDEARLWLARFEREAAGFDIDYKVVQSRNLGANRIPARATVQSLGQLARVIGAASDLAAFEELTAVTAAVVPELEPWVRANPMTVLRNAAVWDRALTAVRWITTHDVTGMYLRQIDAEGVDTKFVERHQRLIDDLLCAILPPKGVGAEDAVGIGFAAKFGFRSKPSYTRLRFLDPVLQPTPGLSEITARTEELVQLAPTGEKVFIVENEITYLAFPEVAKSVVVFGSGFALASLVRTSNSAWLSDREVVYWGDIDTHGFDILSRLRAAFPTVRSILMDRGTLLAHRQQWVTEGSPTNRALPNLTYDEASLYRDLVEATYGDSIRLEQERVRFSLLERALETRNRVW